MRDASVSGPDTTVPTMSSFGLRPAFDHVVAWPVQETRARLLERFAANTPALEVHDFPGLVGLHFRDEERRFWSPRLMLMLEPGANNSTRVQGIYGPEMEIWSVFLYGYLITGLLGTFSGVLGLAQRMTGANPWGWWVTGAMSALATGLYAAAQIGQRLARPQTAALHAVYLAAVGSW